MKKCYKCKIEKELYEFFKDKTHVDGLASHCKQCKLDHYYKNISGLHVPNNLRVITELENSLKSNKIGLEF